MKKIIFAAVLALFSAVSFAAVPDFNTVTAQYGIINTHNNATNTYAETLNGSYVLPDTNVFLFGQVQHINTTRFALSEGNDAVVGAGVIFPIGDNTALYTSAGFSIGNVFSKTHDNRYGEQLNVGVRTMLTPRLEVRAGGQVLHANNNDGLRYSNQFFGTAGVSYAITKSFALTADVQANGNQTQVLGGLQFQF